jgi:hypothetical protein
MNKSRNAQVEGRLTPAKARKEANKKLIVDLYLQGHNMRDVARLASEKTGGAKFTASVVGRYVNQEIAKWQSEKNHMIEAHKAIELAKINHLETEYWAGWLRSQDLIRAKTSTKEKDKTTGGLKVVQVRDDQKPTPGDPRFLAGVQWCIDKRCTILGIEIPQTAIQINNNTQNNTTSTTNTTVIRRVVFKTRETTAAPQVIVEQNPE